MLYSSFLGEIHQINKDFDLDELELDTLSEDIVEKLEHGSVNMTSPQKKPRNATPARETHSRAHSACPHSESMEQEQVGLLLACDRKTGGTFEENQSPSSVAIPEDEYGVFNAEEVV
jgi:hypothetical protein